MRAADNILAIALAAMVVGALLAWTLAARWQKGRRRRRFARAARAEQDAVALAEARGYRVLALQVERRFVMKTDGVAQTIIVRADMMLKRRGRRYVAEVKSGKTAPDPTSTATRRQLLEYGTVFDADGLLLFDMEARRIRAVTFSKTTPRRRIVWPWLAVGVLVGWSAAALPMCAALR